MPTPHKTTSNMRKHLTKAERTKRQAAEAELIRGNRVVLKAPAWLGEDARKIFERTKRSLRGLGLLDTTDGELLAMYADAVVRYQNTVKGSDENANMAQVAQAWSRVALSYAEKLGISVSARARLARKKAEAAELDDMERLMGEITEELNSGQADG